MTPATQYRMFDLVQWLPADAADAFARRVKRRQYQAGHLIYAQGDEGAEMYRIVSGHVRMLARTEEGREVVFLRFGPGDCFGVSSLIDDAPRPHTAEAASAVEMEVLSRRDCNELRSEYRGFDAGLLQLMSRMMRYSSGLFRELSLGGIEQRIALRILQGVEAASKAAPRDGPGELALSQSEIALMVGASRQTVNRILNRMQDAGIIATEYNNIVVKDMTGLRGLAVSAPDD